MTGWNFDLNDNTQSVCSNCGRNRISLCLNGKHLCEKCDWCPEENRTITDDEIDGIEEGRQMFNNNLIIKPQGPTVAKITITMDAKGQATMKANSVDPFGAEGVLSPFMAAQLLSQVLATVIQQLTLSAAKKAIEEAGNNGSQKLTE